MVVLRRLLFAIVALTVVPSPAQAVEGADPVPILAWWRSVDSQYTSIDGEESPGWKAFVELRDTASSDRLRWLLHHTSPVVRAYAFRALVARSEATPEDLIERLDDRAIVRTRSGCVGRQRFGADDSFAAMAFHLEDPGRQQVLEALLSKPELSSRGFALREWTPAPALRGSVVEHARMRSSGALIALARYRRSEDTALLATAIAEGNREALVAATVFPHPALLPALREARARRLHAVEPQDLYAFHTGLALFGPQTLEAFVARLDTVHRRRRAFAMFGTLREDPDPAAIPKLFRIWEDHGLIDCAVFERLVGSDPDRALDALEHALSDVNRLPDSEPCLAALLRTWSDARGVSGQGVLVDALTASDSEHFVVLAAEAASVQAAGSAEVLLDRLRRDPSPGVAVAAATALLAYDDDEVRRRLAIGVRRRIRGARGRTRAELYAVLRSLRDREQPDRGLAPFR
ncbi:MAG: hypothetical protein R3F61_23175 [Myxococcota bacterium]